MTVIETNLSGGIKTWGMILLFAWTLSILGLVYEWLFSDCIELTSNACELVSHVINVIG